MKRRLFLAAPALLLARPGAAQDAAWFDQWEAVLRRHVNARGQVDFAGIAAAPDALAEVVATVGRFGPPAGPTAALAHHINAYNALAMYGIVLRGIPQALSFTGRFGFFVNTTVIVAGQRTSLKSYEDDVIRRIGEERVHFALNCMVRGCPRLPREAFRAARLEAQLAAAAREFCESPYHVRPNPPDRSVQVSQIFEFFTGDFVPAKAPSLLAYLNLWRREKFPADWRVHFFPYDWTVNRQAGGDASG
jgi:hypothetical protein